MVCASPKAINRRNGMGLGRPVSKGRAGKAEAKDVVAAAERERALPDPTAAPHNGSASLLQNRARSEAPDPCAGREDARPFLQKKRRPSHSDWGAGVGRSEKHQLPAVPRGSKRTAATIY